MKKLLFLLALVSAPMINAGGGPEDDIRMMSVIPNTDKVVTVSADGTVGLWTQDGIPLKKFTRQIPMPMGEADPHHSEFLDLPYEIICEICLWLPPQDAESFRATCKRGYRTHKTACKVFPQAMSTWKYPAQRQVIGGLNSQSLSTTMCDDGHIRVATVVTNPMGPATVQVLRQEGGTFVLEAALDDPTQTGDMKIVKLSGSGRLAITTAFNNDAPIIWARQADRTWTQLFTLDHPITGGTIESGSFSPDEQQVITFHSGGGMPQGIFLWDLPAAQGEQPRAQRLPFPSHTNTSPVGSCTFTFSPSGRMLVASEILNNLTFVYYRQADGRWTQNQALIGHSNNREGKIAISPNEQLIAIPNTQNCVRIWSNKNGTWEVSANLGKFDFITSSVCFFPDSQILAIGLGDGSTQMFVLQADGSWTPLSTLGSHSRGHSSTVRYLMVSPDGQQLVSVGADKRVIIWGQNTFHRQIINKQTEHAAGHELPEVDREEWNANFLD